MKKRTKMRFFLHISKKSSTFAAKNEDHLPIVDKKIVAS